MKRVMAVVLMLAGSAAWAAAAGWSNADWKYRAQVAAYTPDDKENPLVEWDVDFGNLLARAGATGSFDPNSPRVMIVQSGHEKEVPCRFFPDKDAPAKGRLCWLRLGAMPANSTDTYSVYFDEGTSKEAKSYPELARAKPVLGNNLLANGPLTAPDKAGPSKAASWTYDAAQPSGTVEWLRKADQAGNCALKIVNTAGGTTMVTASQQAPVEAGKRYALSGWVRTGKDAQEGAAALTGWLRTADGKAVSGPDGDYSNHKVQLNIFAKGECPWKYLCRASISVYDPKTKTNHTVDDDKTLPGTGLMDVNLDYCYGKGTAYFTGLELREMPSGLPIGIWVTSVEKKPSGLSKNGWTGS